MRHSLLLLPLGFLALGCGDLFSHFEGDAGPQPDGSLGRDAGGDAGPKGDGDGGNATDAGSDGGPGSSDAGNPPDGGADAGADDGGQDSGSNTLVDAGVPDAGWVDAGFGDGGGLSWGTNLAGASDHIYTAVAGTSATDFYVLGTSASITTLSHFDGNALTAVYSNPLLGFGSFDGLWVSPDGEVFAGGQDFLLSCLQDCSGSGTYTVTTVNDTLVQGLCGAPGSNGPIVYAVGEDLGTQHGWVWGFDPSDAGWSVLSSDAGAPGFYACWLSPAGDFFVSSTGVVAHYDTHANLIAVEQPPQASDLRYQAICGAASLVFAAGDSATVVARDMMSGAWTTVMAPQLNAGVFHALGGLNNELWAGGFPNPNGPQYSQAHFFQDSWSYENDFDGLLNIYGVWAPNPGTVVVAGQQLDSLGGIVGAGLYIGTR